VRQREKELDENKWKVETLLVDGNLAWDMACWVFLSAYDEM
jgi:hypothetical protein